MKALRIVGNGCAPRSVRFLPNELQSFQRLWNSHAPRRCDECNGDLPEDDTGTLCKACKKRPMKHTTLTCATLVEESSKTCGGPLTFARGFSQCEKCGLGKELQETIASRSKTPDWVYHPIQVLQGKYIQLQELEDEDRVKPWTKKQRL